MLRLELCRAVTTAGHTYGWGRMTCSWKGTARPSCGDRHAAGPVKRSARYEACPDDLCQMQTRPASTRHQHRSRASSTLCVTSGQVQERDRLGHCARPGRTSGSASAPALFHLSSTPATAGATSTSRTARSAPAGSPMAAYACSAWLMVVELPDRSAACRPTSSAPCPATRRA